MTVALMLWMLKLSGMLDSVTSGSANSSASTNSEPWITGMAWYRRPRSASSNTSTSHLLRTVRSRCAMMARHARKLSIDASRIICLSAWTPDQTALM